MRKTIKIGSKEYRYKKEALSFYKEILNSYEFGEVLIDEHFNDVVDLLNYDESYFENHPEFRKLSDKISNKKTLINIRIGKAQFNTKCFELVYDDGESEFVSYILRINKPKQNYFQNFYKSARNSINDDLRSVKQAYFDENSKNGYVMCQESGIKSSWKELVVDHRQPNTFSMIVDRFIELLKIDLKLIEYITDDNNFFIFKDKELVKQFQEYHKEKAVLRVIRKELNLRRAHQGRVKQNGKDLKIKTLKK